MNRLASHASSAFRTIFINPTNKLTYLKKRPISGIIVFVHLVAILALVLFWIIKPDTQFSIDAETEALSVTIYPNSTSPKWGNLVPILTAQDSLPTSCNPSGFTFSESFIRPVNLRFSLAEDGSLIVVADAVDQSLGRLECQDGENFDAPSYLTFVLSKQSDEVATLRYFGQLVVGREVKDNSLRNLVLTSGNIYIRSKPLLFSGPESVAEMSIQMGDEVHFYSDALESPSQSSGVVRAGNGTFRVVAHYMGPNVQSIKSGQRAAEKIVISPSLFSRLQSQSDWAMMVLLSTITLSLLQVIWKINSERRESAE